MLLPRWLGVHDRDRHLRQYIPTGPARSNACARRLTVRHPYRPTPPSSVRRQHVQRCRIDLVHRLPVWQHQRRRVGNMRLQ